MRRAWMAILICGCLLANGIPFAPRILSVSPASNSSLPTQTPSCCCRPETCRMAACPGHAGASLPGLRFAACAQSACSAPMPLPPPRAGLVFMLPAPVTLCFATGSSLRFRPLRAALRFLPVPPLDQPPRGCGSPFPDGRA
ncbi:MAG TPA: hypothetical protein VKU00_32240 [Chthonomonadaceae bacterium]|nr:hypothetical protein [Chthonomonadaceae bacterium]